jgi:twitching motility protein PilT
VLTLAREAADRARVVTTSRDDSLLGRVALKLDLVSPDELAEAQRACQAAAGGVTLDQMLLERGAITPSEREKLLSVYKSVVAKARAQQPPAPAVRAAPASAAPPLGDLAAILRASVAAGASDTHIHARTPLRFRIRGELVAQTEAPLEAEASEQLVLQALDADARARFLAQGETDFCHVLPGVGRFRGNAFRQLRGADAVLRFVPDEVPTLEQLGLPAGLARFTDFHQGMVLVTGPAGCGKSTTLAALIDLVNQKRRDHILTVEDPIEFVHPSKGCLVNQRNAGQHTESFARALRAALREDPDVISIGELRDLETISLAITAAETGHFVLASLHTESAIRTVDRLIGAFPPNQQEQVRAMLAESLRAVISQRLCRSADGARLVPALEVLVVTKPVGKLIRDQKTFQLPSVMQTGSAQGMRLLDDSLAELVKSGAIAQEEALRHCADPRRFGGAA